MSGGQAVRSKQLTWVSRSLAVVVCIAWMLAPQYGCGKHDLEAERGGHAMSTPEPVRGLVLEASCAAVKARDRDRLVVEVRIVNVGPTPVQINRLLDPCGNLWLVFADSAGRRIGSPGVAARMARSATKEGFLTLGPEHFYGARLQLVAGSEDGRRYYSLMSLPGVPVEQRFYFGPPGRYSLTVEWQAPDDGRLAGISAWSGGLHSEKVWFEIPAAAVNSP